jgi:single-strand DNA-binding protein
MALSVNKVQLLGNVGKEPEYKTLPSGVTLCTFSIGTNESYKDKTTDEWKSNTEWHNLECWRGLADLANKHLHKGTKVYIEGKLKTESYDKNGTTMYRTKVVASEIVLIDKSNNQNQNQPQQNEPRPPQFGENYEDDVPF